MEAEQVIQGRLLRSADIAWVRHLLTTQPEWNRTRLSRELCQHWNWRNGVGLLKDMACRTLLLKLERLGQIRLPARQRPSVNAFRNAKPVEVFHDSQPITGELKALRPLLIDVLNERHPDQALFKFLLQQYHYLGLRNGVGENLKYLARDRQGRPLACLLFGSAAWKAQARDQFIGWNVSCRHQRLTRLTNNTRFLVLPWVRVPHLASHLLSQVSRRICADWLEKYGHPIELLETFVDRDRFHGTCYRAAGWRHVGATTGRSRNDVNKTLRVAVKDIYLLPLTVEFRRRLCA